MHDPIASNGFVLQSDQDEADFAAEYIQARNRFKASHGGKEPDAKEEQAIANGVINKFRSANKFVQTTDSKVKDKAVSGYAAAAQAAADRKQKAQKSRGMLEAGSNGEMIFTDSAVKNQFAQKVDSAVEAAKAANPNLDEAKFRADYEGKLAQKYMEAGLMISSSTTLGAREALAHEMSYTRYEDLSDELKELMTEDEHHARQAALQQQAAVLKSSAAEAILEGLADGKCKVEDLGLQNPADVQQVKAAVEGELVTSEVVQSLVKNGDLQRLGQELSAAGVDPELIYDFGDPKAARDDPEATFAGKKGTIVGKFLKANKTVGAVNTKSAQEQKLYEAKTGNTNGSNGSGGSK